jgi:hypothetical protein
MPIRRDEMKHWTKSELDYLQDNWGSITIPAIAKNLNRSIYAVKEKALRLNLGRHLHNGNEITLNQLFVALGKGTSYGWLANRWFRNGFPVKYKISIKKKYKVISIDDFWKWSEGHKNLLDFSRFESNMLGEEPKWVDEKRKADILAARYKKVPWTKEEDTYLISLLNSYKYGYKEISERLHRTEGAIKRRMVDLKIKQRPLKADNHIPWTESEFNLLMDMRQKGYSWEVISEKIGTRSSLAVRGKIERIEGKYQCQK